VGHHFFKEPKSLQTLQLEELETIIMTWFKQAYTANTSIDEHHLKEKALQVAASQGTRGGW
jgi:hypothetical protein